LFPLSFTWGVFLAPVEATATTLMQNTPNSIRGRILSAAGTLTGTANVVSMAVAGILGTVIGARSVFIIGGVLGIIGGLAAALLMYEKRALPALEAEPIASIESGPLGD
jgi:MFS family permease